MLKVVRGVWKSIGAGMFLLGLFWLPADLQTYDQALSPWQRLWAMTDRETLLWVFALGLFAWLVWTDVRPFLRRHMADRLPARHPDICSALAEELAKMQMIVLAFDNWSKRDSAEVELRNNELDQAAGRVDTLCAQLYYDGDTFDAVQSFASLCVAYLRAVTDGEPTRQLADQIYEASAPLFRMLHGGRRLSPSEVPEPRWPQDIEEKTRR